MSLIIDGFCSPLVCLFNKGIHCGYMSYLPAMRQLFILYLCIIRVVFMTMK